MNSNSVRNFSRMAASLVVPAALALPLISRQMVSAGSPSDRGRSRGGNSVSYPDTGASVSNIQHPAGGGTTGTISECGSGCVGNAQVGSSVSYSGTLSGMCGCDVYVTNDPPSGSSSSSDGGGGGGGGGYPAGSSQSGGSQGNGGSNSNGSTGSGHFENQCTTSSGK